MSVILEQIRADEGITGARARKSAQRLADQNPTRDPDRDKGPKAAGCNNGRDKVTGELKVEAAPRAEGEPVQCSFTFDGPEEAA